MAVPASLRRLLAVWPHRFGVNGISVASFMCEAVFKGDVTMLRRALLSGAPPDACDYDK